MSGLTLLMVIAPMVVIVFVAIWVAWWLTADFLSTPRATDTLRKALTEQRRETARGLSAREQLRIAR